MRARLTVVSPEQRAVGGRQPPFSAECCVGMRSRGWGAGRGGGGGSIQRNSQSGAARARRPERAAPAGRPRASVWAPHGACICPGRRSSSACSAVQRRSYAIMPEGGFFDPSAQAYGQRLPPVVFLRGNAVTNAGNDTVRRRGSGAPRACRHVGMPWRRDLHRACIGHPWERHGVSAATSAMAPHSAAAAALSSCGHGRPSFMARIAVVGRQRPPRHRWPASIARADSALCEHHTSTDSRQLQTMCVRTPHRHQFSAPRLAIGVWVLVDRPARVVAQSGAPERGLRLAPACLNLCAFVSVSFYPFVLPFFRSRICAFTWGRGAGSHQVCAARRCAPWAPVCRSRRFRSARSRARIGTIHVPCPCVAIDCPLWRTG